MIEYIFGLAMLVCFIRVLLGPTFADRLIAVAAVGNILLVLLAYYSLVYALAFLLDIAITLSVLSLVGTLAVAKYATGKETE